MVRLSLADLIWYMYPLVVVGGFATGFINTVAGSGSLISLPLLISLGLPANVANGTNRVAIVLQNAIGATKFDQAGILDRRAVLRLGIPAILGGIVGAQIAVDMNEAIMRRTIGFLLVAMLFVILLRPRRWLEGREPGSRALPWWGHSILLFFVGTYGGFIQAGVGIFFLSTLVLGVGFDLVKANAVKVGINLLQTLAALWVFVIHRQVVWGIGILLAVGTMLGAWTAASIAVDKGAVWVHRILVVVVALAALHMIGVTDVVLSLFA